MEGTTEDSRLEEGIQVVKDNLEVGNLAAKDSLGVDNLVAKDSLGVGSLVVKDILVGNPLVGGNLEVGNPGTTTRDIVVDSRPWEVIEGSPPYLEDNNHRVGVCTFPLVV